MTTKSKLQSARTTGELPVRYDAPRARKTENRKAKAETNPKFEMLKNGETWGADEQASLLREPSSAYGSTPAPGPFSELEMRTQKFALNVRAFVKKLPNTIANQEDIRQLVRSSGSVGANYIEANESLGKKDFQMHVKISRKEAKESRYWLSLLDCAASAELDRARGVLMQEATELMNIFGSIYRRSM